MARRACLIEDIEFEGDECPSCGSPGVPGGLSDFCPHGRRKPYRGWPCPQCRQAFIDVHRQPGLME